MHADRTSSTGALPDDPIGTAVAEFVAALVGRASVELHYAPQGTPPSELSRADESSVLASATREVLDGCCTNLTIRVERQIPGLTTDDTSPATDLLAALPGAALRAASHFRETVSTKASELSPTIRRALRDSVIVEFLADLQRGRSRHPEPSRLLADTLEYLIELSGTRVESQNLTHGVVIADIFEETPRLSVPYPDGLRPAKRSPLLFDGQRSVLIVDTLGRARTELQQHRLERLLPDPELGADGHAYVDSGSLVALGTRRFGGIGFFLREDRSIWAFVDGHPLVVRRGEHWTAFPFWLATAIGDAIGGGYAVDLVVEAALMISVQRSGAIFGIVDEAGVLDGVVADKDRYDLRNHVDLAAMRPETRLHHLIDVTDMDAQTLARLAALDGATIVDRHGALLAYGAIVSTEDSQHEGARTAAARTLSKTALVVLKVSEDGEISVFRDGESAVTLLHAGGLVTEP